MKILNYRFLISFILSMSLICIQFKIGDRTDVTYTGQFLVLLIGILNISKNLKLKISLWLLLVADITYYLLVYKFGYSTEDKFVVLYSSFSYFFSFNIFSFILLQKSTHTFSKILRRNSELLVTCFFLGAAGYYILYPGVLKAITTGVSFGHLSNVITVLSSLPLAIVAYVFLTNNNRIKNQPVLLGFFILGILDIGIQLETIRYGNLQFTLYDIFWYMGVFLISYGAKDFNENDLIIIETTSIVSLIKNIFFISALSTVVLFSFLIGNIAEITPMYLIFIIISIFIFGILFANLISKKISSYNDSIKSLLGKPEDISINRIIESTALEFKDSFVEVYKSAIEQKSMELESERNSLQQTRRIYRQMAHDITSPLSVLQSVSNSAVIDPKSKELLRNATLRVRLIAEDILVKGRKSSRELETSKSSISLNKVQRLLSDLVKEKEIEYSKFGKDIKINVNTSFDHKDLSVLGTEKELARLISNLLNNSYESLLQTGLGQISLSAEIEGKYVLLKISDNGPGFPQKILSHDFSTPLTLGKASGNGFGLFSAVKTMQKWDGILSLENNHGACVTLKLKLIDSEMNQEFTDLNNFLQSNQMSL